MPCGVEREDLAAAGSLASRALACVDDASPGLADLLLTGCDDSDTASEEPADDGSEGESSARG